VIVLGCALVAACQSYAPLPLPTSDNLATNVASGPAQRGWLTPSSYQAPGSDPVLSMRDAATLAVINNPDLKAAVESVKVADAKLYAAHLIPDPQLTWSIDSPLEHMVGLVNAYGIMPSYDIQALILHRSEVKGAEASRRQSALSVEWQAWQLAQKARDLFIQGKFLEERLVLLERNVALFRQDYDREKKALASGDVTSAAVSADLVALADADRDLRAARRQAAANHIALAAVMGVRPEIAFRLGDLSSLPSEVNNVDSLSASLPRRRPDLLALRAGYESQEATVRRAILAQFPSINIGVNRSRDNTDVNAIGPGVTMNLPIFNRNRGQIATEEATRGRLRAEYQARIDQSISDVRAIQTEVSLLKQEIPSLEWSVGELRTAVARARHGFETGDFPALNFVSMQTSLNAKELELLDRRQMIWQAANNMAVLLADGPRELAPPWTIRQ
jgi:cobalt-zinc-cadmium efflux system outer membrane protein